MMRRFCCLFAMLAFILLSGEARAWGDLGHKIICEIAFRLVQQDTQAAMRQQYDYRPRMHRWRRADQRFVQFRRVPFRWRVNDPRWRRCEDQTSMNDGETSIFFGASLLGGISGEQRPGATLGTGGIISGSCLFGAPSIVGLLVRSLTGDNSLTLQTFRAVNFRPRVSVELK